MNVSKNIKWSPTDYANTAVLARDVGDEMLSRLDWVTLQPNVILDVGCGTGEMSAKLQQRYPEALVIALDLSEPMIQFTKEQTKVSSCLCADASVMPFQDASVDLICANLMTPWHQDLPALLREWRRVLRPDGLLMLTILGLDTFREWRDIFLDEHIPQLVDMHDVGDMLLQVGLSDPVLDVNYYTVTYRDKETFLAEMYASGMLVSVPDVSSLNDIELFEGDVLSVTYEVANAHAFAPPVSNEIAPSADGVARVPLSHLRKQLKNKS